MRLDPPYLSSLSQPSPEALLLRPAMSATAIRSSRPRNYRVGIDRNSRSLFAARTAAILLIASITAATFVASHVLAPHLRDLLRSSSSSASSSSPGVLWLFVVVIAAAIWILHGATAVHDRPQPHRDGLHYFSGWTAQFWHDDGMYPPPEYGDDVMTSESAFGAEAMRRKSRAVEPEAEEEAAEDDDESMEAMWKAIVRRRGGGGAAVKKSKERIKSKDIDLRRRVMYEEGVKKKKKKPTEALEAGGGWRKREVLVAANDELFHRVESFIKNHYDHLKLQRQESEQRRILEMFRHRHRS